MQCRRILEFSDDYSIGLEIKLQKKSSLYTCPHSGLFNKCCPLAESKLLWVGLRGILFLLRKPESTCCPILVSKWFARHRQHHTDIRIYI